MFGYDDIETVNIADLEDTRPSSLNWFGVVAAVILSEFLKYNGGGGNPVTAFAHNPISFIAREGFFYAFMFLVPALWTRRLIRKPDTSYRQSWGMLFFVSFIGCTLVMLCIVLLAFGVLGLL
jgi:hypothetical protein